MKNAFDKLENLFDAMYYSYLPHQKNGGTGWKYESGYWNFFDVFPHALQKGIVYSFTIAENIVLNEFAKLNALPSNKSLWLNQLIELVNVSLKKNVQPYFIVFALEKCSLANDLDFGDFYFIKPSTKAEVISKLVNKYKMLEKNIKSSIEHAEKSRTLNFEKQVIVSVRFKTQVDTFYGQGAMRLSNRITRFIWLLHQSEQFQETKKTAISIVQPLQLPLVSETQHTMILTKKGETVIFGNESLKPRYAAWFDLDFLSSSIMQSMLVELHKTFVIAKNADELTDKFFVALKLFCDGLEMRYFDRDKNLALLLYCSAAEKIITENSIGKKREPLSKILSTMTTISNVQNIDVVKLVDSLYKKRSGFVHAGQNIHDKDVDDNLDILEYVFSKFFLQYYNFKGKNRVVKWEKLLKKHLK